MKVFRVTPTISAAAYADGDAVGTLFQIPNTYIQELLKSLTVVNKSGTTPGLIFHIFNGPVTPPGDNNVVDFTESELPETYLGIIKFASSAWTVVNTNDISFVTLSNIDLILERQMNGAFYVLIQTDDNVTFTSTSDLTLIFGFQ